MALGTTLGTPPLSLATPLPTLTSVRPHPAARCGGTVGEASRPLWTSSTLYRTLDTASWSTTGSWIRPPGGLLEVSGYLAGPPGGLRVPGRASWYYLAGSRYLLVLPGRVQVPPGTTWQGPGTSWQGPGTTWQGLVPPGRVWYLQGTWQGLVPPGYLAGSW